MGIDIFDVCDTDSNDADISKLEINTEFARRLEHNKKREALHRLDDLKRRGLGGSSDEDSDDESDDDDSGGAEAAIEGSPNHDLRFYDALVKIKNRDPALDQKDAKLFSDDDSDEDEASLESKKPRVSKKERPLYLKDVMAQHLIEEGPEFDDKPLKHASKIYKKEQVDDIKAFLDAEKEALGSDEDGEEVFKRKEAGEEEMEEGENDVEIQKRLDEYFGRDGDLNENEMFLKNYLKNKMWVGKEEDKKPSFEVSDDEDELDKQDKYEAEYNFRHEEVEGDRVLGHSRHIEGSVRKKTSSRQVQRKSKEERMALAEMERKKELKELKNLKKKEIQEKLEKIRAIAGIGDDSACKLGEDDLEEDFDPEEYDKKMREMFDVDYYQAEDANPGFGSDDEGDLEKPDFDKEDELLGLSKDRNLGQHESTEGFAAARERFLKQKEEEDGPEKKEGKRKRKRKVSLEEKVELEKKFEEYYNLDYEDTIGDLKTRFKYTPVPANRYGLSAEEILMANDKNLNQYVSLKKLVPYREKQWRVTYHQKLKKKSILQGENLEGKKKSKNPGLKVNSVSGEPGTKTEVEVPYGEASISRKSRRRRRQADLKLSRSRLMAYGKIPSKPPQEK